MVSIKVEYIKNIFFSLSNKMWLLFFGFLYTFIIANYLGPEKYGIINYYNSFALGLLGIFGVTFLQGLITVFVPQNKSRSLFEKVIKFQIIITFLLFLLLATGAERIAGFLSKSYYEYLRLAALLLLVMPLSDSTKYLYQGFKRFGLVLKINMLFTFLNLILAIILVIFLGLDIFGVLYATLIATVIGTSFFLKYFPTLPFANNTVDYSAIKKYTKWALPSSLAYRFDGQAFTILIGLFVAEKELGLYYMAYKIASIPIATPTLAMAEVLYPHLGEAKENKDLMIKYASKSIKASIITSITIGVVIALFSKLILSILFPLYADAYRLVLLLVPTFIMGLIFNILAPLYAVLNRMDLFARVSFAGLLATIIFGWLFMLKFGVSGIALTLLARGLIVSGYALYNLGSIGLQLDIVPRRNDIYYFVNTLKEMVKRIIQ